MLIFEQKSKWHIETKILENGDRYTVSKSLIEGDAKYAAWCNKQPMARPVDTLDAAKAICELHYLEGKK